MGGFTLEYTGIGFGEPSPHVHPLDHTPLAATLSPPVPCSGHPSSCADASLASAPGRQGNPLGTAPLLLPRPHPPSPHPHLLPNHLRLRPPPPHHCALNFRQPLPPSRSRLRRSRRLRRRHSYPAWGGENRQFHDAPSRRYVRRGRPGLGRTACRFRVKDVEDGHSCTLASPCKR